MDDTGEEGWCAVARTTVKIVIAPTFYAEVRDRTKALLDKAAGAVAADARHIVPFRTGKLHSKIGHKVLSSQRARISAKTHYAVYVELGTHNEDGSIRMHAQPYLRPALYQVRVGAWGVR